MRHDITFPLFVEVDEIYNLACPASPIHYQHDPVQTTKTSVHGAINMLGLAKRLNAGSSRPRPAKSTAIPRFTRRPDPIGAMSIRSARAPATTRASAAPRRCSSIITVSMGSRSRWRGSSTYGPRMHPRDGRVVSNFIVQALKGEPITIYGDGSQTRSFCYVDDLVEGFIRLMDSPADFTGPVNLGNPGEFTIRELAELVVRMVKSIELEFRPLPADDPRQRRPDIALAGTRLGWSPTVTLTRASRRRSSISERWRQPAPVDPQPSDLGARIGTSAGVARRAITARRM